MKPRRYPIYVVIAAIVFLMLIFGRQPESQEEKTEEGTQDSAGSGFIEIETSPNDADIFLDGANKGRSPIVIGNVAAGMHEILIKKEGYDDFAKQINVDAGRRTSIEAGLTASIEEKTEIPEEKTGGFGNNQPAAEGVDAAREKDGGAMNEGTEAAQDTISGKINLGVKFLVYYDFSSRKFEEGRAGDYDVFSKRYENHLTFTRNNPAQMKVIDKNIADVEKRDCEGISGGYGQLRAGQSVCVITKEGLTAAVGGSWPENTENAALSWKVFS